MMMKEQYEQMKKDYIVKYGGISIPHEVRKLSNAMLEIMNKEVAHKEIFRREKVRMRRQLKALMHKQLMSQSA